MVSSVWLVLWQGLQRDVEYSVTAAEMVICSGCWKESPVEKEQTSSWGWKPQLKKSMCLLHGRVVQGPFRLVYNLAPWVFSIPNKLSHGAVAFPAPWERQYWAERSIIPMPCKGEAQKEQDLTASQEGSVRQARSTHITGEKLSDRTTLGL